MAKRYLTDQQRTRIAKKQQDLLVADQDISATQEGLIIAHYGKTLDVETAAGETFRCHARQNLGAIAAGDQVLFGLTLQNEGIITAIKPRHSELYRYNKFEGNKLVAANIDQLFIITAAEPKRALNVIDRYLVLAHLQHIKPIIVFNKIDTLDTETLAAFDDFFSDYIELGYQVIYTSAVTEQLTALTALLPHKNSIFLGVSGVGKSSIIQALLPEETLTIGELSAKSGEGTHTTTTAKLFHLAGGGNLIDCPGIRELNLGELTAQQVISGFYDLAVLAEKCQFRNCSHEHEPGCAILAAEKTDTINHDRLASYRTIMTQIAEGF